MNEITWSDMNEITWSAMLKDVEIYNMAITQITRDQNVLHLLSYKKLAMFMADKKTLNVRVCDETQLVDGKPIRGIINKLLDNNKSYFNSNADRITLDTLINFVCAVLSKYLMIDKLVRQHLFTFSTQDNSLTFNLYEYSHTPMTSPTSDEDIFVYLKYNVVDYKQNFTYDDYYTIKLSADDFFVIDQLKGIQLTDAIKDSLEHTVFDLKFSHQKPNSMGISVNVGNTVGNATIVLLENLVKKIKDMICIDAKITL